MKIRLVICNSLIAFLENISLAEIVVYIVSTIHESKVWRRRSLGYAVKNAKKSTIKTLQEFSFLQNAYTTEEKPHGLYKVNFNAPQLSSGVYFYQIKAGDFVKCKKMLIIK